MKKKFKKYRFFNLPNKFTPLEQYFYYLKELDVIPNKIPSKIIEKIFINISKDYLEGYLDYNLYSFLIENLYSNYMLGTINIDKNIENLIDVIVGDEENEKEENVKKRLKSTKIKF